MPSDNILVLPLILLPCLVNLIFYELSDKLKFISQYDTDETAYNKARNELYIEMNNKNNTSFGPFLHNYLLTKLTLEGVAQWSYWGKSVRMFRTFKTIIIGSLVCILLLSFALWIIAEYYLEPTGIEMVNKILVVFSFYLTFVLVLWLVNAIYCDSLYTKRKNENLLAPTIEMLTNDKAVPDHGLVLLSSLLTKVKNEKPSVKTLEDDVVEELEKK